MKKHLLLFIFCTLVLPLNTILAEEYVVAELSKSRESIGFKPLSSEDKFAIIRHAKILFSKIYVNLEHKKKLYQIDPLSVLEQLEKNRDHLSEEDFHRSMLLVFNSVKDFHVNYNLPRPYACYGTVLPLGFSKIDGDKIIVSAVNLSWSESLPELSEINIGDELVAYNGISPLEAISNRSPFIGTSTPDARIQQGVYDLFWRGLWSTMIPEEDAVDLTLKHENGQLYSLTLPWFSRVLKSCLEAKEEPEASNEKDNGDTFFKHFKERKNYLEKMRSRYYTFFRPHQSVGGVEKVKLSNLNTTKHKDLFWKILNYKNNKFGYLKLKSFEADDGVNAAVNEVTSVLKQMGETSTLVIDLRGNYGGQISFAEKMMALLTANPPHPLPFYIRANELTLALYDSSVTWRELIAPAASVNSIVGPAEITPVKDLENISQIYFGKVVLLTNSECFSSCDIFAATMKDNAGVTIYGTDHSTFGGGANVWSSNDLATIFKVLDIKTVLPQNISMRITGRHARRLKDHSLIEDAGVKTDVLLSVSKDDVLNPESSAAVARILNDLIKNKLQQRSDETSLNMSEDVFIVHDKENLIIHAHPKGISYVTLFNRDQFLGRFTKGLNQEIVIELPLKDFPYGSRGLTLFGFNKETGPRPVLRKHLSIESLAPIKKLADADLINDALFTNDPTNIKCGWTKMGRSLVLPGNYCNISVMDANLSLLLPAESRHLEFDLVLDTEADYDFFQVLVISEGKVETLLAPVSGQLAEHIDLDMSRFAGKKIDLKFRLISDELGAGKGIEISHLNFK